MTSPSISAYLKYHQPALEQLGVQVDPALPVHPTFLYESLWCLAGFILVTWFSKRRRFDGQVTLLYLAWYGLGRFLIEGLRTDSLLLGTIRVSQLLALLCFLAASGLMIFILSKIRREGDPDYLPLYRDTEEGRLVLAGEFYKKPEKKAGKENAPAEEAGADSEEAAEEELSPEEGEEPDSGDEDAPEAEEKEVEDGVADAGEDEENGKAD